MITRAKRLQHVVFCVAISLLSSAVVVAADQIQFDLPPVIAAEVSPENESHVTVELRLSSMITTPTLPAIDQWLVRCQPRDAAITIADYAPRTETASDVSSPIQVKQVEEKNLTLGLSANGSYGHLANGSLGADQCNKNTNSFEFQRQAAVQAVTAAGTINRGRGVYFKLRWTAQQVLEGEKVFRITLAVPTNWRGSLMDVSVIAQSDRKKFGGFDRETKTIGSANFVVATYRAGDNVAADRAGRIADAEYALRNLAGRMKSKSTPHSLPSMLRAVAIKLDLEPSVADTRWLARFLQGATDPYLDDQITKLPMPVRIAALDYADSRDDFVSLNRSETPQPTGTRVVVAKPAIE